MRLTGSPVAVVEDVATRSLAGVGHFAVSGSGSLAYVRGGEGASERQRTMVWVDRRGTATAIPIPPKGFESPRISPDGQQLALNISPGGRGEVWIYNVARGTLTRFTFATGETPASAIWMAYWSA